jgi:uncharacterized YigZ family protein
MFSDTYKTIVHASEGIFKDKGSKFIAFAIPVINEEQVKEHLQEIKKKFYDARHHCYAYALGPNRDAWRTNDDGEPSGTAGKPIYGQILSKDITNVLIVVVRYFGGVKLGVRGLINAYRAASIDALQNSIIEERTITEVYAITFEYPQLNDVMRIIKDNDLEQISQNFELSCELLFSVRKSHADHIKSVFSGLEGINISYRHTM